MDGLDPEIKWPLAVFITFVAIMIFTVVLVLTNH